MSHIRYYSTQEVARMLGVTPRTVRNACQEGKIGHVRIGGVYRIGEHHLAEIEYTRERRESLRKIGSPPTERSEHDVDPVLTHD